MAIVGRSSRDQDKIQKVAQDNGHSSKLCKISVQEQASEGLQLQEPFDGEK